MNFFSHALFEESERRITLQSSADMAIYMYHASLTLVLNAFNSWLYVSFTILVSKILREMSLEENHENIVTL